MGAKLKKLGGKGRYIVTVDEIKKQNKKEHSTKVSPQ
jgi:hypothetical protein